VGFPWGGAPGEAAGGPTIPSWWFPHTSLITQMGVPGGGVVGWGRKMLVLLITTPTITTSLSASSWGIFLAMFLKIKIFLRPKS